MDAAGGQLAAEQDMGHAMDVGRAAAMDAAGGQLAAEQDVGHAMDVGHAAAMDAAGGQLAAEQDARGAAEGGLSFRGASGGAAVGAVAALVSDAGEQDHRASIEAAAEWEEEEGMICVGERDAAAAADQAAREAALALAAAAARVAPAQATQTREDGEGESCEAAEAVRQCRAAATRAQEEQSLCRVEWDMRHGAFEAGPQLAANQERGTWYQGLEGAELPPAFHGGVGGVEGGFLPGTSSRLNRMQVLPRAKTVGARAFFAGEHDLSRTGRRSARSTATGLPDRTSAEAMALSVRQMGALLPMPQRCAADAEPVAPRVLSRDAYRSPVPAFALTSHRCVRPVRFPMLGSRRRLWARARALETPATVHTYTAVHAYTVMAVPDVKWGTQGGQLLGHALSHQSPHSGSCLAAAAKNASTHGAT